MAGLAMPAGAGAGLAIAEPLIATGMRCAASRRAAWRELGLQDQVSPEPEPPKPPRSEEDGGMMGN